MDINIAKEKFKELNKTLVQDTDINTSGKVAYICDIHKDTGIQYGYYHNILRGHGCSECGKVKMFGKKRLDKNIYQTEVEGKALNFVDVIFKQGKSYVQYICPQHSDKGVQEMCYQNIKSSKIPCKYCRQIDYTYDSFINQLKDLFPNARLISEYPKRANDDIELECLLDNCKWKTTPSRVLNQKQGCPKCGERICNSYLKKLKTHEEFVNEIADKLPHIKIVSQYTGSHDDIKCLCSIHNTY